MKRLFMFACAFALVFSLGASSALAEGYRQQSPEKRTSASLRRGSSKPVGLRGLRAPAILGSRLLNGIGLFKPAFGGGTALDPVMLPFPSELPSGTLDSAGHTDDVYWFYMDAGASMDFNLNPANHGAQIALKVFPDGSDLSESQVLLSDDYYYYPHTTNFTAPWNGYYLLDIRAVNGASTYEMPYDWWYGPNEDIYPADDAICPVLPAAPVSEWLSANWDVDDVYRAPLRAGDKLSLNLSAVYAAGTSNLDLDLFLLGPNAASVWDHTIALNPATVAQSMLAPPAADLITYKAPTTGNYFVDVAIDTGSGPSYLKWTVSPARPSIARSPSSSRPTYRRKKGVAKYTLGARFTNGVGLQVAATKVILQTSTNGKKWKSSYTLTTNANGSTSKAFSSKKKGTKYYRWAIKTASGKYAYTGSQKVTIK